jgi:hypothetical protein
MAIGSSIFESYTPFLALGVALAIGFFDDIQRRGGLE